MNTAVIAEAKLVSESYNDPRINKILRVNATSPHAAFTPMLRPTKATPPSDSVFERKDYSTGDGEFQTYAHRPGCMDFKKYPSHGNLT